MAISVTRGCQRLMPRGWGSFLPLAALPTSVIVSYDVTQVRLVGQGFQTADTSIADAKLHLTTTFKRPAALAKAPKKAERVLLVKQADGATLELLDFEREDGQFHSANSSAPTFTARLSAPEAELRIRQHKRACQPDFSVRRTASENIPVYLRWKNNCNKVSTVLLKTRGNKKVLKAELAALCQAPVVDAGRYIEVMGNHQRIIKQWLKQIGF